MADSNPGATPAPSAPSTTPTPAASSTPASASPTPAAAAPKASSTPPGAARLTGEPAPAPAGETPAQTEVRKEIERRKYKLKVDGQEFEEEFSDDQIAAEIQKARAANKRFQEAARKEKDIESALGLFQKDPWEAAKHLGIDLDKLAEERLARKYEEAVLPEHERKVLQLQRELEAERAEKTKYAQEREAEQQRVRDQQAYERTVSEFQAALKQVSIPANEATLARMAQIQRDYMKQTGVPLSPSQLAQELEGEMRGTTQSFVKGLTGESLIKFLGPDVVREILKHEVARVRGAGGQPAAPKPPVTQDVTESEERKARAKFVTEAEFKKFMRGD